MNFDVYDNLIRANTSLGSLGTSAQGYTPAVLGFTSGSFGAIAQGQISSNTIICDPNYTIYPRYDLKQLARTFSITFGWSTSGSHAWTQSLAMIMTADPGLFSVMRHVTLDPSTLTIQKTFNGVANLVTVGLFTLPGSLRDGKRHTITVENTTTAVSVTIDELHYTVPDPDSMAVIGNYVVPEIYSPNADAYTLSYYDVGANF